MLRKSRRVMSRSMPRSRSSGVSAGSGVWDALVMRRAPRGGRSGKRRAASGERRAGQRMAAPFLFRNQNGFAFHIMRSTSGPGIVAGYRLAPQSFLAVPARTAIVSGSVGSHRHRPWKRWLAPPSSLVGAGRDRPGKSRRMRPTCVIAIPMLDADIYGIATKLSPAYWSGRMRKWITWNLVTPAYQLPALRHDGGHDGVRTRKRIRRRRAQAHPAPRVTPSRQVAPRRRPMFRQGPNGIRT